MLHVLLQGTLTAAPVARTGTRGPFTTAQMRAAGEDGQTVWCSVIAFSTSAGEALAALASGDSVAIAGEASLSHWESSAGEHRVGLRVTAQQVMTVYEAGRRRKAAAGAREVST